MLRPLPMRGQSAAAKSSISSLTMFYLRLPPTHKARLSITSLGAEERANHEEDGSCEPQGVIDSYKLLWKLLYLPPVRSLLLILLSCRVGFAAVDAATQLKIIERGVPKEELAFLAPLLVPFAIICPFLNSAAAAASLLLLLFDVAAAAVAAAAFPEACCCCCCCMLLLLAHAAAAAAVSMLLCPVPVRPVQRWVERQCHWLALRAVAATPVFYGGHSSTAFFGVLFLITTLYNICSDLMFVSMMAFFARVSDPRIGGSYMTFLNTVANVGSQHEAAAAAGDICSSIVCVRVEFCGVSSGVCWSAICWPRLQRLQQLPLRSWRVFISAVQSDTPLEDLKKDTSSSSNNSTSSSEVAAAAAADVKKGE
ncbi:hypothetical protein Emed_007531 [Eimeria media]